MAARHILFGFVLLWLAHGYGSDGGSLSLVSILEKLLISGELFTEAIKAYEELADQYRAKAIVKVKNFMNMPLTQCTVVTTDGITSSTIPISIFAGTKEAVAVQQNKPLKGLDMTLGCRLESRAILIHFQVKQKVIGRKSNVLDVHIADDRANTFIRDPEDFIDRQKPFPSYKEVGPPIQCSSNEFAVQATMSMGNHAELNIRVYPLKVDNLANQYNVTDRDWAQSELNAILDFPQCDDSPSVSVVSHVGFSWN